ncbi:MAG: purine-nucleoside/S-methyl-5-thioadenosine phosphorylase / adenosine deaminase [Actinomycetota bacterium]|nr:purine-nucleoside/S-methyl-5-thioadenosine phosphorylase / adenosine deaminase [Actinomycetota bacterium]
MLSHEERLPGACFAVSDRHGGVSRAPYDSLNLALHVGDDPLAVAANRRRLAEAVGVTSVAWMDQVHGREVVLVDVPASAPPRADALVTRTRGLALAVMVADCTPVLAADPAAGVVGVAHAGRKGLALGVVPAMLAAMRRAGATSIEARIGPSICALCYPVPAALRDEVAAVVPASAAHARDGSPALDIAAGVLAQLSAEGVPATRLPGCSAEDDALFSYRRDAGVTGRYAGLVWLT